MSHQPETCGQCKCFRKDFQQPRGKCWGMPPTIWPSGSQQHTQPTVQVNRVACAFFRPLPEGSPPLEYVKKDFDTPGDALRIKNLEKSKNGK